MKITHDIPKLPADYAPKPGAHPGASKFQSFLLENMDQKAATRKEAEDAAAGLVSNALILPMLKQLRRSSLDQKGPFSPGIAEKTFGPEFDMQIADRLARSPRMGATQVLTERLMKRHGGAKAATASKVLNTHG